MTAEIVVPATGAEGVIVAQGGNAGGWSLYAKAGSSNTATTFSASSASTLNRTARCLRVHTRSAWNLHMTVVAWPRVARHRCLWMARKLVRARSLPLQPMLFSADDGCDVGVDTGAPVSPDYGSRGNEFTGTVKGVQIAIAEDAESVDHRESRGSIGWRWRCSKTPATTRRLDLT